MKIIVFAFVPLVCSRSYADPNILLIIADDVGWKDLAVHGGTRAPTPHIDALFQSGTEFRRFYATPTCKPTRLSLYTGKHPNEFGLLGVTQPGLPAGESTINDDFPNHASAFFGKWGVGHASPGGLGGDPLDYWPAGWKADNTKSAVWNTKTATNKACNWILQQNSDWFCVASLVCVHAPIESSAAYRARSNDGSDYGGMLVCLDDAVGDLMECAGNDTIVFFLSDNGASLAHGGSNGALRGGKHDLYEGGIRVRACASGPGIDAGSSGKLLAVQDVSDIIAGTIEFGQLYQPVRGDWALSYPGRRMVVTKEWKLFERPENQFELYDMLTDPQETDNVFFVPANRDIRKALRFLLLPW